MRLDRPLDNLAFMRSTEVFLNFVPACSIEAIRLSFIGRNAGKTNQAVIFDDLGGRNFDARTRFFYMATVNTPALTPRRAWYRIRSTRPAEWPGVYCRTPGGT